MGIGQSDALYKRHKAISKNPEPAPNTNIRSNVVDLTTPVAPVPMGDPNAAPMGQLDPAAPINGPVGIARPTAVNGVYRPGQTTAPGQVNGVPRPASPYTRPASSGSVYVRDANGQRRI